MGKHVAIVGGDLACLELAEFIAERGRRVSLFCGGEVVAPEIGPKRRLEHELRLERLGVSINAAARVRHVKRRSLTVEFNGGAVAEVAIDTVLVPGEPIADTALYENLKHRGLSCHAIGDCTGLGLIVKATAEAAALAQTL